LTQEIPNLLTAKEHKKESTNETENVLKVDRSRNKEKI
jgi:hypothetical protein